MLATQVFAIATAGMLYDNSLSQAPVNIRVANETGSGDVRLAGTPTGLTASSGFRWMPTHGLVQQIPVNAGGQLAVCANATQSLSLLIDR